jgi:putative spermidine/putrescine transport system substrate-binding protein
VLAACGAGSATSTGTSAGTTNALTAASTVSSAAPSVPATASSATTSATAAASTTTSANVASAATTSTTAAAAAASSAPAKAGGNVTLHLYVGGDTNIQDLWNNGLLPTWNKANPTMAVQLIFSEHGTGDQASYDKLAAAQQAKKPTDIDLFEGDTRLQQGGEAGLFEKMDAGKVPNIAKTDPNVVKQYSSFGVPYRASSVVLAYNSQFVKDPPTTLDGIYAWIKANKGKFAYNPPDTGGSGQHFVVATLKKFIPTDQLATFQTGYDAKLESSWDQGFALLKSLGPFMENNGFYPKGNVPILQELGKQTIYVAPVWSDQGLTYLAQKLLPATVKLSTIDPPFSGGAAYLGVPTGSEHKDQAYQFINWVLEPAQQTVIINKVNGYPGLEWQYMPADVQAKFADLAKAYDTFGFSSKFSSDLNKAWYEKVAGTPPPAPAS